jgi:prophage antirepressor-like protein
MSFFVDLFNNILKYNDKTVFIVIDINNTIWFKMKDVLKLLGYYNISKSNRIYHIKYTYKIKIKYANFILLYFLL